MTTGKEEEVYHDPPPGFRFHPSDEELVRVFQRTAEKRPSFIELIKQVDNYKYDPRDLTSDLIKRSLSVDIYKYDRPWDLPSSSNVEDKEWYFFCKRGRKYRNSIRPNRVITGSGFWKATGIDKQIDSSEGSRDCIGLKKSQVYYQPQWEEYKVGELGGEKRGSISGGSNGIRDDWINSPLEQHVMDMPSDVDPQSEDPIENELGYYKTISKATHAITAPAAGALLTFAISRGLSDHPSWTAICMVVAIVIGLAFSVASIGLNRVKRPMLSGIMIKLGAISTASAIILALGLTVPPAVAWTAGAVSFLLVLIGVAMA